MQLNLWQILLALFEGAFGNKVNLVTTLSKTTPLILTGLSVAIPLQCGLFNIGSEGQLYIGGITAADVGILFPQLSPWLYPGLTLACAFLAGAIWGMIPAWLKLKRGAHEVISTIMLNYIAIYFTSYLVRGPLNQGGYIPKTTPVASSARLGMLLDMQVVQLNYGILLALAVCIALAWFLRRTVPGYELRAAGLNPLAARQAGINMEAQVMSAMALGGGLAGLAGAVEVLGVHYAFYAQFSPGYGYDGIAVALLASAQPLAILPAALLFAALRTADRWMQLKAGVPKDIILIIQAVIIMMVAVKSLWRKKRLE